MNIGIALNKSIICNWNYFMFYNIFKKLMKLNKHFSKNKQQDRAENINCQFIDDSFLINNRQERMDANRIDLFDKTRCDFHLDRYRLACEYVEDKFCLDIASGLGYGADCLYRLGRAQKVHGVELNMEAVEYSKAKYSCEFVNFQQGSVLNIPFKDNFFDVVTSFETIEHIEDEKKQLKEIQRVLKKGGYYILSTPNDWTTDIDNPYHVRRYNYQTLKKAISEYFTIVKIYNQNSGTPNRPENRNQPRRICKATNNNQIWAECFIVIAKNDKKPVLLPFIFKTIKNLKKTVRAMKYIT